MRSTQGQDAAIAVGVSGAAGRMGSTVCLSVEAQDDMLLCGRADPTLGVDLREILSDCDVVVDFTTPATVFDNARTCLEHGVHAVIGTTGLRDDQLAELGLLAETGSAKCIVAPNFALGAVLMMIVSRQIARHLPDCEIVELHHEKKLDAPSGTAKLTAELVAGERGGTEPPIHSVRLPGLVAHQEVIFGGLGQTLTVRHDSISRESFMPGVMLAVRRVASLEGLEIGLERLLME